VHATHTAYLPTRHGDFRIHGYRDLRTGAEHVALVASQGLADQPIIRVHSECLTGDAFGSARCDCGPQLDAALELAAEQGGAVVYLRGHEGRGIGLLAKVAAYALQDQGRDTVEANLDLGWEADRREYGAAAAILTGLGAHRITLLTNNPAKVAGLRAHGIDVAEVRGLEVGRTPHNAAYLRTKAASMGHVLHLEPGTHQGVPIHLEPVQAAPAAPDVDTADHILDSELTETDPTNQETTA
jgi:3,4-dihydroxy 2-butanone 4-phosphate synthase/GTP cyclohydrolase II